MPIDINNLHWNYNVPRNGPIGENLSHTSKSTFFVSDLQETVEFYSKIMRFDLLSIDGTSAVFDAKTIYLEFKVGIPTFFAAQNLIVGHISIDVPDFKEAFDYFTQKKIPFEINVSVPKGAGKAESEGGSAENTVGQAFLRDPDGYYLEVCNCHILTDFVLGLSDDQILDGYEESLKVANTFRASVMLKISAQQSKKNLSINNNLKLVEPLSLEDQPKESCPTILENFMKRRDVYGDICQSFSPEALDQILREAGNSASTAVLLMKDRIKTGQVSKVYQPPAYYVGEIDKSSKYNPQALIVGEDEKGRHMIKPAQLSAGVSSFLKKKRKDVEEKKSSDEHTSTLPFEVSSVNHIAFIVSDVGRSIYFYSEILGLQQVKRPNFDRHGAWFTGGNTEFHLILGNPLAPMRTAKASESNITRFIVKDFDAAKKKLSKMPATEKAEIQLEIGTDRDDEEVIYMRDPDGYLFGISS